MGSLEVGHNRATSLSLFTFMHWRRKWQPTPVFLPAESQGRGSLVGCRLWGRTEFDTTEVTWQQQQQQLTKQSTNNPVRDRYCSPCLPRKAYKILKRTYCLSRKPVLVNFAAAKSLQSCPALCDPMTAAHQAPPSLGFSRQEHWSGLPFPSPTCESEVTQSCPTQRPDGLQPTRVLCHEDFV